MWLHCAWYITEHVDTLTLQELTQSDRCTQIQASHWLTRVHG